MIFSLSCAMSGGGEGCRRSWMGRDQSLILAGRGKKSYTTRGVHTLVASAAKAADIDKPVSSHWLRHSFATLAAVGGAPAHQLLAALGPS